MGTFAWAKGHGTENDFIVLPDADTRIHGDLDADFVAELCDRRRGVGADGVLRVVRSTALGINDGSTWFMDYRNADGTVSEMCGNGVRVFAAYLVREGLVDPAEPEPVSTRDGVKTVAFEPDGRYTVDMGVPRTLGDTKVAVGERTWSAMHVETGNPHAVAFVDDLADAGTLVDEPAYDRAEYPNGVNIEFVVPRGEGYVAMRVHERGSGETRSCGTGACAVAVAAAVRDGAAPAATNAPATYRIDLPGGRLDVTWRPDGRLLMTGSAAIVADGELSWHGG
ncbi:diaminopimelate epimerase [Solicola gregarius]|uniref:Diaminopimelate epimerase n=1 Tax=Solicola gregarius TaxID=2908642 RepID=A0AA46TGU1_9ACTN|nr:diaminopimelate epimerase [Solicola gregarius]UYM04579.1 diaminopimelate epimerase [Solicola gregarius]